MLSVLWVVLPIFALILAGWLGRRSGALGPHATTELNRFVVYLALPALLFDIVANASWADLWQPGFSAAFGLGAGAVFLVTLLWRLARSRQLADASVEGLNAAYANTGFVGFPLALAVFGRDALAPVLIATIITVSVLFALALVLIEIGVQVQRQPRELVCKVGLALVRNPLLLAPVLGALTLVAGLTIPPPAEVFLKLLGGAASPCALVALGLFLAERRPPAAGSGGLLVAGLIALKLLIQPLLTWWLAVHVFDLPPMLTHVAVLMAALPTGTGPFMVAEFYRRDARTTAAVVLWSTVLSLLTITLYLGYVA